jgi:hypothetical protein
MSTEFRTHIRQSRKFAPQGTLAIDCIGLDIGRLQTVTPRLQWPPETRNLAGAQLQ